MAKKQRPAPAEAEATVKEPGMKASAPVEVYDLRIFKVLEARVDGKTIPKIAEELNIPVNKVKLYLTQGLDLMVAESAEKAEEVRQIELLRLDKIVETHMPHIIHPRHADLILKTMERRARYLGLDKQPEVNGQEEAATALRNFLASAKSSTGVSEE